MAYASVNELKAEMTLIDAAGADSDTLDRMLEAATQAIDRYCNRPDGFLADEDASARYYMGDGRAWLFIDECVEITAVAVKDSATDTSYTAWAKPTSNMSADGDYFAFSGDPYNPELNALPYNAVAVDPNGDYTTFTDGQYLGRRGFSRLDTYRRALPTVKVTARWGYAATVPPAIKTACIMQCARWYKRLSSAMANILTSDTFGTLVYKGLDPDVEMLLTRYRRPAVPGGR